MDEHDLSAYIPRGAVAVELHAVIHPENGVIELREQAHDQHGVTMTNGSTTIIEVPPDRRVYVTRMPADIRVQFKIARLFR
jgi:hypothetical protein